MTDAFVQFDASDLDNIAIGFGATTVEINKAIKRATNRTTKWLRTQILRTSSEAIKVTQKNFRKRLFLKIDRDNYGSIWVGLNPISLSLLSPRQNKRGVRAKSIFRESAFILPKSGLVAKRKGKKRFPIQKQVMPIDEVMNGLLKNRIFRSDMVAEKFMKEFESNLQWRTSQ